MQSNNYFSTPPVVKNLLIINALFLLALEFLPTGTVNAMYNTLGLHYWESQYFMPHQLITHMFMHAGVGHFVTNMFALWMFGRVLEYDLGPKRFLVYYMVCGIGAGLLQLGVNAIEIANLKVAVAEHTATYRELMAHINGVTVGASGAVFGILLGFGMLHPNSVIMLLFPPIPMKAKYFVMIYGVIELFAGIRGSVDGIAHFAHVGGMVWGFMLLWYWKKRHKIFY